MIAKIAVSAANYAIDKPYSYDVPEGMRLAPGTRVTVPFGRGNRPSEGIVLTVEDSSGEELKSVSQCLDEEPVISERMLQLAEFLRERYFCTFYEAARVMLPAGLWFHTKQTVSLTADRSWQEMKLRQLQAVKILEMLKNSGGCTEETVLREAFEAEEDFQTGMRYLLRKKWIQTQTDYLRRTRDKTEQIATLTASAEEARDYAASRTKSAAMQRAVLNLLCGVGTVSVKELCYFTGAKPTTVRRLAELGYITLTDKPVLRCREIRPIHLKEPLILNDRQKQVFEKLNLQREAEKPGVALLFGVTGSGKTSVYLKLIRQCLDAGKSVILLVPEIALTPQLLGILAAHFQNTVAVLHSSLAAGERYDQWKRIRDGAARVVVGTRSAVFAPCQNLGLVILDEEQEHSYKSETSPRYDAREVAVWRGAKEKALVVFGSATPSIETMYRAKTGIYQLYTLPERYNGGALPRVELADMKEEIKKGNDLAYSEILQSAIQETAAQGKQAILFLNRRGNSRAMVCINCGEAPECPRCSAKLTYHSANERLMCHYCGFSQRVPQRCPACGGPLKKVGVGTQKAQQELADLFPDLEIDRMDADTVSAVNTHEKILNHFKENRIPVLLGTQMVAKGLNLPNVTLVGVLDADLSLYSGSFRAAETTFNMLTQVVGRAGRGDTPGRAVIQTVVPEHIVMNLAAKQDYEGFYELEIPLRRMQKFPPFGDLASVTFTGQDEAQVLRGGEKFRESLDYCLKSPDYHQEICHILGPAPCPVPKINYNFRYRLSLRCQMTKNLRSLLAYLLRQFSMDRKNRGVTVFADVNGMDE